MLRNRVLSTYRKIICFANHWVALNPSETFNEKQYIKKEAREKFRENKFVSLIFK